MHGGCYFIVMDYHFLQAKASLFVGTIGHRVCWWNASALQPAIQLEVSISKSLQLWGKPKIMRKITGTQLPISVSCPRQAHRQRRPCYLYAFAGAGNLQPGWRPINGPTWTWRLYMFIWFIWKNVNFYDIRMVQFRIAVWQGGYVPPVNLIPFVASIAPQEWAGTGLEPRWSQERRDFQGKVRYPVARLKHHYLGGQMLVHLFKELICFQAYLST